MKRRRIREIVAAAVGCDVLDVVCEKLRDSGVEVRVAGDFIVGSYTKRDAMRGAFIECARSWQRPWPALRLDERKRASQGSSLDVLAVLPSIFEPDAAVLRRGVLEHLREPVALPQEARRG